MSVHNFMLFAWLRMDTKEAIVAGNQSCVLLWSKGEAHVQSNID